MMRKSATYYQRACAAIAAAVLLTGCVLQSAQPVFPEDKGVAILDKLGTRFTSESLSNDEWKAEEGVVIFAKSGNHYVAHNEEDKGEVDILFASLGGDRYVMQAREEPTKPFAYMIVEVSDNHLVMAPLLCEELKKIPGIDARVHFDGDDCGVTGTADADYFNALAKDIGPGRMRLTPVK